MCVHTHVIRVSVVAVRVCVYVYNLQQVLLNAMYVANRPLSVCVYVCHLCVVGVSVVRGACVSAMQGVLNPMCVLPGTVCVTMNATLPSQSFPNVCAVKIA